MSLDTADAVMDGNSGYTVSEPESQEVNCVSTGWFEKTDLITGEESGSRGFVQCCGGG